MSANQAFLILVFTGIFIYVGVASYRTSGMSGLKSYLKGVLAGIVFIGGAMGLHLALHCMMETCRDSMFYLLLP